MADYISRQAAIDGLQAEIDNPMQNPLIRCGIRLAMNTIDELPSANVQEQIDNAYMHGYTAAEARYRDALRHGHWVASDEDGFVCSICRCGYKDQPTLMGKPMFDYCPVCGARMDGDKDE